MRLPTEVQLPQNPDTAYAKLLAFQLKAIFRPLIQKVNALADGQLSATDNAATAAPTTGTYAKGDVIRNSAPTELGVLTSKYVITQWVCTVGGTPGTWLACRSLTGN